MPPITISPTTPAGTGLSAASVTRTLVPGSGRPIATAPPSGRMRQIVDQTVVSVGPYMFQSAPQQRSKRSASVRVSASPPTTICRVSAPSQPCSVNARQVDGVACIRSGR